MLSFNFSDNEFSRRRTKPTGVLFGILLLIPSFAVAQSIEEGKFAEIGIDQKLDEQLPLDLVFNNEKDRQVALREYFGDKPVALSLVYYECPMLCTQVLNGLLRSLQTLAFDVGREFEVVTVSFDPGETPALAAAKKKEYLKRYDREGAEKGWHFLTGTQDQIDRLTKAVGFRYQYDAETDNYVHASGIMVLTPQGKLARYFYGIEYAPKDLRLGLIEAADNKIGSPVDQLLLLCYRYDPTTGKYGLVIMNSLRIAGFATVAILALFVAIMLRRERKQGLNQVES
jgi:protein SCO1/2